MLKKLRRKFILINMSLVLLVLTAVLAAGLISTAVHFRSEYTLALDREAADGLKGGRNRMLRMGSPKDDLGGRAGKLSFTAVQGADGVWTLDAPWLQMEEDALRALCGRALSAPRDTGFWPDSAVAFRRAEGRIAFVSLQSEYAQLKTSFLIWPLVYVAALAVFFALSLAFSRWALRPVETAWQKQKRFISDAGHELKTPLTVMLANLEISRREQDSPWLQAAQAEGLRMKKLILDMLFLARGDEGAPGIDIRKVSLSHAVSESALAFEASAYEGGQRIESHIGPGIHVAGDAGLLRQLCDILMDNAVKYTPRGGRIAVTLERAGDRARLTVRNSGDPIPQDKLPHLFDRFFRAEDSRTQAGCGLGLSIAREIALRHGGGITAESSQQHGTTLTVLMPLWKK